MTKRLSDQQIEVPNLTILLNKASSGDQRAAEIAWSAMQSDIRQLAELASRSETRSDADLQPTVIMQEVWLRLFAENSNDSPHKTAWNHRGHFWGAISKAIQRFLIDESRKESALKRGGDHKIESLQIHADELRDIRKIRHPDIPDLIESLKELRAVSPEAAQVAEHRYLMGMNVKLTAHSLGISPRTVNFRWTYAQAWIRRRLDENSSQKRISGKGD